MQFKNLNTKKPFLIFQEYYLAAESAGQPHVEAGCITSVDQEYKPHSRYVNFKYLFEDSIIFFSNYTSNKANDFKNNENVAVNFWWPSTDVQVRLEGIISKCSENFSDEHFNSREIGKNAAAIASDQSKPIESYEILQAKFEQVKEAISSGEIQQNRPPDWGGYQIKIAFFEFWEANEERLNYRECYKLENDEWQRYFLQS
tara:strand:+ start:4705 stop:5307 length:603 start_codon:yes stop_codon:yes gene_type:complete